MSFKFRWICDLLQEVEENRVNKIASRSRAYDPDRKVIEQWFRRHDTRIPRKGPDAVAFLSSLFPQKRVDRVYEMQEANVSTTFGRCLQLSTTRKEQLNRWRTMGVRDVASCIELVMHETEFPDPPPGFEVTLEEIDYVLEQIAAGAKYSSPEVRDKKEHNIDPKKILGSIIRRLKGWQAKWLARIILKDFRTVTLDERFAMLQYHFLLPELLRIQNSFPSVVARLEEIEGLRIPHRCLKEDLQKFRDKAAAQLAPTIGLYIRRPVYEKARSVKHCCDLAASRRVSLERKYDGEYCQIHINTLFDKPLKNPTIQIFSKSGKDSTKDRERLRDALKRGLRLWQQDCKIKERCILEGELLVFNDRKRDIQPFDKIRKHVPRSGRYLGTALDSPNYDEEHLMIMFYDILLWDEKICIYEPHNVRRSLLHQLITIIPGHAEIGTRQTINFNSGKAAKQLRDAFAKSITDRWEGFVLKGCDDPYYPALKSVERFPRPIKLKKDYIAGLGDIVDFVVIGGRYDAKDVDAIRDYFPGRIWWTSFYITCLDNKDAHIKYGQKPKFKVIGLVGKHNVTKEDFIALNQLGDFERVDLPSKEISEHFDVDEGPFSVRPMASLFKKPFVLEMTGSGFEKPQNANFWSLRFPRSSRLHLDRSFEDATTFQELQILADAAGKVADHESQSDKNWIEKLEIAERRKAYLVDKSQSSSPGKSAQTTPLSLGSVVTRPNTWAESSSPSPMVRMDSSEMRKDEFRRPGGYVETTSPTVRRLPPKTLSKKRKDSPFESTLPTKRIRASPPILKRSRIAPTAEIIDTMTSVGGAPLQEIDNLAICRQKKWSSSSVSLVPAEKNRLDLKSTLSQSKFQPLGGEASTARDQTEEKLIKTRADSNSVIVKVSACRSISGAALGHGQVQENQKNQANVSSVSRGSPEPIPTPPIFSAEDRTSLPDKTETSNLQTIPFQPQTPPPTNPISTRTSSIYVDFNPPLAIQPHPSIPFSIAPPLAELPSNRGFHNLLKSSHLSFTYSRSHFLDSICGTSPATSDHIDNPKVTAIALVRAAIPQDVAKMIKHLQHELEEKRESGHLNCATGQVLFLDWTILRAWPSFCGMVDAETMRRSIKLCFAGRVVWGWKEEQPQPQLRSSKTGMKTRKRRKLENGRKALHTESEYEGTAYDPLQRRYITSSSSSPPPHLARGRDKITAVNATTVSKEGKMLHEAMTRDAEEKGQAAESTERRKRRREGEDAYEGRDMCTKKRRFFRDLDELDGDLSS
ncbi:MAG: hypothetical protein Q9227_003422 [Pyrenula ochraceoflavens]